MTLTIVLRYCFYAASSNLCRDPFFFFFGMTVFLLVFVATMFLELSAFLSRPGKSIMTESCLELT